MNRKRLGTGLATAAVAVGLAVPTGAGASITYTTDCVKHPGPTDTLETTGTNPANHQPPGQQSQDELSNRECRHA